MKRRSSIRRRHVEILRLRPGDVLVYRTDRKLDPAERDLLMDQIKGLTGGRNKVAVVTDGDLLVARPEDET